jgi:hypothetical protein
MRNTVEKNSVCINDLRTVDPRTPILKNRKDQIRTLETFDRDITQRSGEDDIARNDMVLEDFLQGCLVCRLEHGTYGLKGLIGRYENGKVGDVKTGGFRAGEAKVDGELGGFEGGVHGKVARAIGEELERCAKRQDCIDFVDGDAFA